MKKFNPTPAAIEAATRVFAAMALLDLATQADFNIRQQILEAGTYKSDRARFGHIKYPHVPDIIKDPKIDYLIDGLNTDDPNTDWARYHSEWHRRMEVADWRHGANTVCRLDNLLREARYNLFIEVQKNPDLPFIEWESLTANLDFYKQYFNLVLRMYAPAIGDTKTVQDKILKEFTYQTINL